MTCSSVRYTPYLIEKIKNLSKLERFFVPVTREGPDNPPFPSF
jgi:hypothetical protein